MEDRVRDLVKRYGLEELVGRTPRLHELLGELAAGGAAGPDGEMLRAVLEAIPGFVSWFTSDLVYLGVNRNLAETFARKPEDFPGKPIDFLGAGGRLVEFMREFVASPADRRSLVMDIPFGKDKHAAWILFAACKYNGGRNILLIGLEMTDLKQMEAALAEQQQRLAASARMASLGEMAAGIAHEINNPLTVMMAHSSLLMRMVEKDSWNHAKLANSVHKLDAMLQRVAAIVGSCRDFSRAGKPEDVQRVAVAKFVGDALELCAGKLQLHGVRLQREVPNDLFIECRPTQISQVLVNLLANAADAVSSANPPRWVHIAASDLGERVELRITDSGPGIPADAAEKIFQPFYTTKKETGTGLGLNICRGIVAEHGGEMNIDSGAKNTCFYVRLPKVRPQGREAKA